VSFAVGAGSGKTTLLNVMAGRVEHGSSMGLLTRLGVEGGVLYNDIALAPQEVPPHTHTHTHTHAHAH
jgi:ABC-type multidrug transport system ATPase subunit